MEEKIAKADRAAPFDGMESKKAPHPRAREFAEGKARADMDLDSGKKK